MPAAFNITASSAICRQSLAKLAWCRQFAEVQLCLAPLSCAARAALPHGLRPHVSVLAQRAAPAQSFSQALRASVCTRPAHPPATSSAGAGSRRCASLLSRPGCLASLCRALRARPMTAKTKTMPLCKKRQSLPSMGILGTNAVKLPVLIALCVFNESASLHAVQG